MLLIRRDLVVIEDVLNYLPDGISTGNNHLEIDGSELEVSDLVKVGFGVIGGVRCKRAADFLFGENAVGCL